MMRRLFAFVLGVCVGYLFDIIPALLEASVGLDQCVESCPRWFKGISWSVYVVMPFFWGTFFAVTLGKPNGRINASSGVVSVSVSVVLMFAVAFYAYAHQVRLL